MRGAVAAQVLRRCQSLALDAQASQCGGSILAQRLAAGADLDLVHLPNGALGGRIKDAQALDFVAEEIDAYG